VNLLNVQACSGHEGPEKLSEKAEDMVPPPAVEFAFEGKWVLPEAEGEVTVLYFDQGYQRRGDW
jgi:hypothetical protein